LRSSVFPRRRSPADQLRMRAALAPTPLTKDQLLQVKEALSKRDIEVGFEAAMSNRAAGAAKKSVAFTRYLAARQAEVIAERKVLGKPDISHLLPFTPRAMAKIARKAVKRLRKHAKARGLAVPSLAELLRPVSLRREAIREAGERALQRLRRRITRRVVHRRQVRLRRVKRKLKRKGLKGVDPNVRKLLRAQKIALEKQIKDLKLQIHMFGQKKMKDWPIEYALLDPPDSSSAKAAKKLLSDLKPFLKDAKSIKQKDLEEGRAALPRMEKLRWKIVDFLNEAKALPLLPEMYRFLG